MADASLGARGSQVAAGGIGHRMRVLE